MQAIQRLFSFRASAAVAVAVFPGRKPTFRGDRFASDHGVACSRKERCWERRSGKTISLII